MEDDRRTPEELLGRRLRGLRHARQWSQAAVANAMNGLGHAWHQTTVAKVENSSRPVRLNEAADLASLFKVSVDNLCAPSEMETRLQNLRASEANLEELLASAMLAISGSQQLAAALMDDLAMLRRQIAALDEGTAGDLDDIVFVDLRGTDEDDKEASRG